MIQSRSMKRLGLTLLLASLVAAQDAPKAMNRIVVQLDSPDVPQNNPARKPRTIYRAGNTYCRQEAASRDLLIVNEPNAWVVDLEAKTAQHTVDSCLLYTSTMPNRERNGAVIKPARVVAPIKVNRLSGKG